MRPLPLLTRVSGWLGESATRLRSLRQGRRVAAWERTVRDRGREVDTLVRASDPGVFSVLIPARSAGPYIGECLSSVLAQRMPEQVELEVVVGVDGCRGTREALARHLAGLPAEQAARVRSLFFTHRQGSYIVRNSLLRVSRGEIVQFVDADDALLPEALTSLWRFAGECRTVAPAFVVRPMARPCDERLNPIQRKPAIQVMGALCFPKSALDLLGGYAPWICSADADFLQRAEAARMPVFSLPRVIYLYRQHEAQLTRASDTGMKSGLRDHYSRRLVDRRARRIRWEAPVVGPADDGDGGIPARGEART